MQQLTEQSSMTTEPKVHAPRAVVVIGASTGGPTALEQILPKFPRDFPASIIVVQHMRPGFIGLVANYIDGLSEIPIERAGTRSQMLEGTALFLPGESSADIEKSQNSREQYYLLKPEYVGSSVERMRKRIDDTMIAVAKQFGSRAIGVLLTGVGDDGRDGLKEIRNRGGKTIAQDEASSVVFDMPRNAIASGVVDEVLPLWNISDRIIELVGDF
jgi:two-component system chemotaxis response regulator CheB